MMLNAFQNKRSGPGGSARRLHHLGGVFTSADGLVFNLDGGAETGLTRVVKGKFVSVVACRYPAILYLQTTTSS